MKSLAEILLAVHDAFDRVQIPHAIGGAIAYGYCSEEPRGTIDVDVNLFVGMDQVDHVLNSLPHEVTVTTADRATAHRDGQVRVRWGDTPVDLFWGTHEFHRQIASEIQFVPFEGSTIPVLGCEALVVFKAMFNRFKDWGDIQAIIDAGTIDCPRVIQRLSALIGAEDPAVVRLTQLCNDIE